VLQTADHVTDAEGLSGRTMPGSGGAAGVRAAVAEGRHECEGSLQGSVERVRVAGGAGCVDQGARRPQHPGGAGRRGDGGGSVRSLRGVGVPGGRQVWRASLAGTNQRQGEQGRQDESWLPGVRWPMRDDAELPLEGLPYGGGAAGAGASLGSEKHECEGSLHGLVEGVRGGGAAGRVDQEARRPRHPGGACRRGEGGGWVTSVRSCRWH